MKLPIFGSWGKKDTAPAPVAQPVPPSVAKSGSMPVNRAKRSDGPDLARSVGHCINLTKKSAGRGALTDVERRFSAVYAVDSFQTQGGLENYFTHCDEPEEWAIARAGFNQMQISQAVPIFDEAAAFWQAYMENFDSEAPTDPDYFVKWRDLDARWSALGIDFDKVLTAYVDKHYPWAPE